MDKRQADKSSERAKIPTLDQVSAGGVAFRRRDSGPEVVIISVGPEGRWQLPKGLVDRGETPELAAIREVREEAGIETELLGLIDKIEYWYVADRAGRRVRYHKFVWFFLLRYKAGDVSEHDWEVNEARWVGLDQAAEMLTYKGEREVFTKARALIEAFESEDDRA
ncbi:MAG TPA: NUDIX domain-containing protein [Blastocatellia bacterium]|nr:NUDIX domain-containing protein [Blastocatellia bacterium]